MRRGISDQRLLVLGLLYERGEMRPAVLAAALESEFGWDCGNALPLLLKPMRLQGLVVTRSSGKAVFYSMTQEGFRVWRDQLEWMQTVLEKCEDTRAVYDLIHRDG